MIEQAASVIATLPTSALLSKIDPSPYHKRTWWGNMTDLAATAREVGIIHPLIVRQVAKRYQLICGERRRRAAEKAELREVPIRIVFPESEEEVILIQAIENLEREDLHPIDVAAYYEELTKAGMDILQIAKRFRRKKGEIERALKLLALGPQARKAFVDGLIDQTGALAIARLGDPTQQRDIIIAVENGALQSEDVAGYVERTYTNSLADAEWRLDDVTLVKAAGSCLGCPKRSGAQVDLFDDNATDRCLDLDCWRTKMAAAFERAQEKIGVNGLQAYEGDPRPLFMPNGAKPQLLRGSGFVDADATCPHLTGHTWGEAIAKSVTKEAPTSFLISDPSGRPRIVFREAVAIKIVRKSDAAAKQAEERAAADPVREGVDGRAEAKVRREVIDRLAAIVVKQDVDGWTWVAVQLLDLISKRSHAATAAQFDTEPTKLVEQIKSNRTGKAIAMVAMLREIAEAGGEYPRSLHDLAELANTSISEIEIEVRGAAT